MFSKISGTEYQKLFSAAFSHLTTYPESSSIDLHDLAHEVVELHLASCGLEPLELVVSKVFEKRACQDNWASDTLSRQIQHNDYAAAEAALDLGRLYLGSLGRLGLEERRAFHAWTSGYDTSPSALLALVRILRKAIDVSKTGSEKNYRYATGSSWQEQRCYWEEQESWEGYGASPPYPSTDRAHSKRCCH